MGVLGGVGVVHGRVMCLMGCVGFTAAHFQLPPRLGGSMPVRKLIEASTAADSAGFHASSGRMDRNTIEHMELMESMDME